MNTESKLEKWKSLNANLYQLKIGPTYVCKRIGFVLLHHEFCLEIAHKDIYFAD